MYDGDYIPDFEDEIDYDYNDDWNDEINEYDDKD